MTKEEIINELIAINYNKKETSLLKSCITQKQKDMIIEACFDWMISDEKVAIHAYFTQCKSFSFWVKKTIGYTQN